MNEKLAEEYQINVDAHNDTERLNAEDIARDEAMNKSFEGALWA